jgi:preprotein translocase subunit SecG
MIALLAAGGFLGTILSILFIIVCIVLIFMVVITPSSEGGMAAAFGGMGSDSFFGTKAHQHINKFTVFLAVSFLVLAFCINWINKGSGTESGTGRSAIEEKMKNLPTTPKGPGDLPPIPPPNK